VEEELQPLKRYGKAVLAYGSILTQWFIPGRSDIDVAIVTMERDEGRNIRILLEALGKVSPNKYDVRVFELLPLHVKSEVIKNHRVIHGDQAQLGEYLHLEETVQTLRSKKAKSRGHGQGHYNGKETPQKAETETANSTSPMEDLKVKPKPQA